MCSLAVAPGGSLFGHRRQHLADVGGQEVVHLVALKEANANRVSFTRREFKNRTGDSCVSTCVISAR